MNEHIGLRYMFKRDSSFFSLVERRKRRKDDDEAGSGKEAFLRERQHPQTDRWWFLMVDNNQQEDVDDGDERKNEIPLLLVKRAFSSLLHQGAMSHDDWCSRVIMAIVKWASFSFLKRKSEWFDSNRSLKTWWCCRFLMMALMWKFCEEENERRTDAFHAFIPVRSGVLWIAN